MASTTAHPGSINVLPGMRAWYAAAFPPPPPPPPKPRRESARPIPRTPATDEDRRALAALAFPKVNYPVGSFHKRFAMDMADAAELTEGQRRCAWRMVWRYRRQIPDAALVALAKAKLAEWKEAPKCS